MVIHKDGISTFTQSQATPNKADMENVILGFLGMTCLFLMTCWIPLDARFMVRRHSFTGGSDEIPRVVFAAPPPRVVDP